MIYFLFFRLLVPLIVESQFAELRVKLKDTGVNEEATCQ